MKPLIRYTMGRVSRAGWDILTESVRLVKKVYDDFDVVVCHNKLTDGEVCELERLGVAVLRQDDLPKPFAFYDDDEGRVRNFCWKLVPLRLRPGAHELWLDNDIILRDRLAGIDNWLTKNTGLIGTGFNSDYGRFADKLASDLPDKETYCAGLFGLPPGFDFAAEVVKHIDKPLRGFDEQGLVSLVVTSIPDFVVLGQRELALLNERWRPRGLGGHPNGLHFARANRFDDHVYWRAYKIAVTP